ncbi:hypothetical protein SGRA_3141 [Saprospira grandis str. Lewin]|uniref:Uncharacterized protein n=1 Tax=Saprospira grandis (strain Lewin) TaxID=984262 RepID=H6KZU3_SAPGL|nr:hypothetical protein SGRA_3141 [Saprospira grandis str. Lewin]
MNSKKLNQRIEETGLLFGFCLRRLRRLQNASSSYLDGLAFFCTFGPKGAKRPPRSEATRLRDGKWGGEAADQTAKGSAGPSRPASHDRARPDR